MAEELEQYLKDKRSLVEEGLRSVLQQAGGPATLLEAMRYSLLAPGKRLRPVLVILAAEACGGNDREALPAACAVEMIHAYSLIHDDLPAMDDDDLRRGLPTCHKKFGEALAILAGDALLTMAFQVLAEGYPPRTAAGCCGELARGAGAAGMVGGQVEDLGWERSSEARSDGGADLPPRTLEVLEGIHGGKTGALFRACLRLGVWVAQGERAEGVDRATLRALDAYGRCFGQAFQVTDDLLDVEGNVAQLGKRVQKDAVRGKLTYPGLLGVAESRRLAQQLCEEARVQLTSLGQNGHYLAAVVGRIVERKQ